MRLVAIGGMGRRSRAVEPREAAVTRSEAVVTRVGAMARVCIVALALIAFRPSFAATTVPLPQSSLVPGGIFILPIESTSAQAPAVTLDGQRAMVLRSGSRWVAVVGLPLSEKPGHLAVLVRDGAAPEKTAGFDITDKHYVAQSQCRWRCIREGGDGRFDVRDFAVDALLVFFREIDFARGDLQRLRDVVFVRDVEAHRFFGCRAIAHEDCQVSWLL